jgi:hypothetical protein
VLPEELGATNTSWPDRAVTLVPPVAFVLQVQIAHVEPRAAHHR